MHSEEPLLGHLYSHLAKFIVKCQKGPFLQIRSHIKGITCYASPKLIKCHVMSTVF